MTQPEFRRFGARQAREVRDIVEGIYRDAYAEAISSGDPFDSPERFMTRSDTYTSSGSGFDMVVALQDGRPIGQT